MVKLETENRNKQRFLAPGQVEAPRGKTEYSGIQMPDSETSDWEQVGGVSRGGLANGRQYLEML